MSFGNITVTTSPTKIVDASCGRRNITITNNSSVAVYIGPNDSITKDNAIPLYEYTTRNQDKIPEGYAGPVYGVTASGTADLRYWEVTI